MFKRFTLLALFVLLFSIVGCTSSGTPMSGLETATRLMPAATAVPVQPIVTPTEAATVAAPTATSLPATIALPTATSTRSAATPTLVARAGQPACTFRAAFAADVTVPDGTAMEPGARFTKTWRLRNDGTCAWGAGSKLRRVVFVDGDQLGTISTVDLPFPELGPGGTVDVSVPMVAPFAPGTYRSQWRLQVDGGPQIGVGPNGDTPLYAQIVVPGAAMTTPVFSWQTFKSPKYGYVIAYPSDMTAVVENRGTIGNAVEVERATFVLQSFARSSTIAVEVAQRAFSIPVECQILTEVAPGMQGCRRSLPQAQGMSQELVWFRVPLSGQGSVYVSMQLTYDDPKYVNALAHMLQSFKYTGTPVTVTPPGTCTYRAAFVADVTVPDNTVLAPGTHFTKTWRVRNEGTCAWGSAGFALHRLVLVGGDPLGAPGSIDLPFPELGPGGTADISVPMVAPMNPGTYTSNWRLLVDTGQQVGSGVNGDNPLYARIVVPGPLPPPTPSPVWNTWGGSKHQYTVDFPATWNIDVQSFQPETPGRDPEAVYLRPPYAQWAMVQIYALRGAPPIKGDENCVKNLTFRGVPACSIDRPNDPVPHRILVFQRGDSYYHIEGWYNSPQQLGVFDEIVRSFQFTR